MKTELNYKNNSVVLDLNYSGAIFVDNVLEGDKLWQFQVYK